MLILIRKVCAYGEEEEGWILVGDKEGTRAGYIPGNYVEEVCPMKS